MYILPTNATYKEILRIISFLTFGVTTVKTEYESNLNNNEHYLLSSSENKAWKQFRHLQDLNQWPLKYWWSALPTELTS